MAQTAKIKLFCDLDGTLIDVSTRHFQVYSEVCEVFGGKPLDKVTYWGLKRKKTKWPELLTKSRLSLDIEPMFLKEFIRKIEDPKYLKLDTLFPGALDTLGKLSITYECYLVSLRRNRNNLLAELEWLKLMSHFTEVLTGHSENDGYDVKITLIKDKLGGQDGVIIGDTEADIITGKELGLKTIAVASGIRDEAYLTALEPDKLITSFREINSII